LAGATVPIVADFSWDGTHECVSPRTGSVICISGQANVRGLGHVEYARDAVGTGQQTADGCPKLTTVGTIWVTGGKATLKGRPADTCGADDNPDAHYLFTISGGTGVLAGATGSGDIVADHGVDRWHGTVSGPRLPLKVAATPTPAPSAQTKTVSSIPGSATAAAPPTTIPSTRAVVAAAASKSSASVAIWVAVPALVAVAGGIAGLLIRRRRRTGSGQGPA
jgi:hypothetical protein